MNQLQGALRANAIFSSLSGLLLILFHRQTAVIFEVPKSRVFWVVGIALLYFAITLVYEIYKQRALGVLFIIIQDLLWVFASMFILLYPVFQISGAGELLIAVVALVVLFMAIWQSKALADIDSSGSGEKQLEFERVFHANKKDVWKLISDVGNYHLVAPNIDTVEIISGEGEGMLRKCSHQKDSWTESCSLWVEEQEYAFEVDTSDPDYPYPFKKLKGSWSLDELGQDQTRVLMRFEFEYKRSFHKLLLHPFLKWKFSKIAEELLDNWQRKI